MEGVVVPSIELTSRNVAAYKQDILRALPDVKSGHADEALAAGIGFRTHAALLVALKAIGPAQLAVEIRADRVVQRLNGLGYSLGDASDLQAALRKAWAQGIWESLHDMDKNVANQN
jgi:hypothetical protein